ncbi:MAG TPA: NUDIX domain-containing protein [Micromonosporaceae bacterium]|nr:NUDIX domain-containing protein [Micromonosporaceae bacterium]
MTERSIPRLAARVLLLDAADRVLLLQAVDPARPDEPYWVTPGGGLDPGEDPAAAAARELHEETGLMLAPQDLGAPVRHEAIEFPFDGTWYRQEQQYFAARVDAWTVAPAALSAVEAATWRGSRWWSARELEDTGERYYPADLPEVLQQLLQRGAVEC